MSTTKTRRKKNGRILNAVREAINFVDDELALVRMDLEHPERFLEFPSDNPPLARWGGNIVDLIEYHIAPQAAGLLQHPSGKPMTYEESVELLEKIFGITIPQPYDRRGRALDRQKNTVFIDEMRKVYVEEAKKRNK